MRRLYLSVGGGAILFVVFLCFLRPVKLYQTRMVRCISCIRLRLQRLFALPVDLHPPSWHAMSHALPTSRVLGRNLHITGFLGVQYLDNVLVKPPAMDLSGLRPLW